MNDDIEDQDFQEESRALRALREERRPPEKLEEQVIGALRKRGMLRGGGSRPRRRAFLALAASLLLFAGGALAGFRFASVSRQPSGEQFVLLLYEGGDFQAPAQGKEEERVDEYRSWARRLGRSGILMSGEKLKDGERVLGRTSPEAGRGTIGGYFVIGARDASQAEEIASSCPHLRHSGSIVIRQIDRL